jgi:HEAT repeat protein
MRLLCRNIKVLLQPRRYRAELAAAIKMQTSCSQLTDNDEARVRAFLQSDSWEVRNCAVKIIAKTNYTPLLPALEEMLLDRSEAGIVRRNCAEMLGCYGHRSAALTQSLTAALADPYWEVRAEAARALARLCDEDGTVEHALLKRLAREKDMEAQAAFVEALGAVAVMQETFDRLAERAVEGPWLVRHQSAVAVAEMAARRPEFAQQAIALIGRLDLLAEGTVTRSVFRQSILQLAEHTRQSQAFPTRDELRLRYFHLKNGWLKTL